GRGKTLCQIDLVAVAGVYVTLDALEGLLVLRRGLFGGEAVLQGKGTGFADRACQSLKQGFSIICFDRGVTYQPALAQLVVADQAPAIEAQLQVGQFDIGPGLHRQLLQCAAKVITDITQRTGAKGQLQRLWPVGWPQL